MRNVLLSLAVAGLMAGCAGNDMAADGTPKLTQAQTHMGHVNKNWPDTPDQMGFLTTAIKEAEIAAYHAEVAASKPDDLAWQQEHAIHVAHAIDPSVTNQGPGLGYGVKHGAVNAAKHIEVAAAMPDATDNVKLHAEHVAASSKNAVMWSDAVIGTVREIQNAQSAAEAAPLTAQLAQQTSAILNGLDANGDGTVSWEPGEGGLLIAQKHMEFMDQGEGLMAGS